MSQKFLITRIKNFSMTVNTEINNSTLKTYDFQLREFFKFTSDLPNYKEIIFNPRCNKNMILLDFCENHYSWEFTRENREILFKNFIKEHVLSGNLFKDRLFIFYRKDFLSKDIIEQYNCKSICSKLINDLNDLIIVLNTKFSDPYTEISMIEILNLFSLQQSDIMFDLQFSEPGLYLRFQRVLELIMKHNSFSQIKDLFLLMRNEN